MSHVTSRKIGGPVRGPANDALRALIKSLIDRNDVPYLYQIAANKKKGEEEEKDGGTATTSVHILVSFYCRG